GMCLRSRWSASSIADPDSSSTLDDYELAVGRKLSHPLPLEDFVAYGDWFQRRIVPDVDRRHVARIEPASDGFRLVLEDGEPLSSRRVVVAAGIAPFGWRPPP